MPITKSGRYSMNPAYAEALDRAAEEERNAQNGKDGGEDGTDGSEDSAASDGDASDAQSKPDGTKDGNKGGEKNAPKKAAVKRIEIEPAENGGFVSRTQRQQPDDGDNQEACGHGGWAPPYEEPELRAHPDGAHLLNFLGRELAK
jgi:hypothetical protein